MSLETTTAPVSYPGKLLVSVGLPSLYHEILASALSSHGWTLVSFAQSRLEPGEIVEIALVTNSPDSETVIANVRRVRAEFPAAKIVLLGLERTDSDLIDFIGEGVCAYVPSSAGIADLVNTLQMVRTNRTPASGRITQMVLNTIGRLSRGERSSGKAPLTDREEEILSLINQGLSNKEIVSRLSIAPSTVKNHVHHLLEKLNVHSRHEAACIGCRRPVGRVPITAWPNLVHQRNTV